MLTKHAPDCLADIRDLCFCRTSTFKPDGLQVTLRGRGCLRRNRTIHTSRGRFAERPNSDDCHLAFQYQHMIDFKEISGARQFELLALPYLRGAVQRLFGGSVKYDARPIGAIKHQHGIDITQNPRRGVYLLEGGAGAVILGRVLEGKEVKAAFSLQLRGASLTGLERFLNVFEAALASTLSHSAAHRFSSKPHQFGDELVEFAISKSFSKGYYDHRSVQQLIEVFHNLSTTRFEGRNFTTGLVLTRSFYAFEQKGNHTREGTLFPLTESRKLSPADPIEKRFWYLADGQSSYFVAGPSLEVGNLFMADASRQVARSFVDDYTLSKTVMGGDVLFRVTSQAELSITGSRGIEFNFKEGRWRVRNLLEIARLVQVTLSVSETFVQRFLFFVFYLSRRRLSSILWVPTDLKQVDALLLSKNQLTATPFSITNERHTQTLIRLLSSDGAAIFTTNGELWSFGSIVDISNVAISGMKGTGESVAAVLGKNGVAVKVSQDGTIKVFLNAMPSPMII